MNGVDTTVVRCPGSLRQLPVASGSPITLATVRAACSCDVPEVAGVAHQLALHCLPDAWRQHVLPGPLRRPQWFVPSCGKWVRDGRAPHQDALEVRPDGRLGPPALPLPEGGIAWAPACVVWCPVPKGQRLLVRVEPRRHLHGLEVFCVEEDPQQAYLLGAWGCPSSLVDPNVWGWGAQLPLSHFVVKGTARRLILLEMVCGRVCLLVLRLVLCPRVWRAWSWSKPVSLRPCGSARLPPLPVLAVGCDAGLRMPAGWSLSMRRLGCAARFPGRTLTSVPPHGLPPPLAGRMMAGMCWCLMAVSARV